MNEDLQFELERNPEDQAIQLEQDEVSTTMEASLQKAAASVSISGRVLSINDRNVFNAAISLTDQNGIVRTVGTNSFGYYQFNDVAAGQTYILTASHKSYRFSPQAVSISENLDRFNLIANN